MTITTRQRDYIESLREGFTPNPDIIARNSEALANTIRGIGGIRTNLRPLLVAREIHGIDATTATGRREQRKARAAADDAIDALTTDELTAKRDEIIAMIPDYAAERVADIEWAETADLGTMSKEDASRAIDILKRHDAFFSEPVFTDVLRAQFIDWYAAQ